MSARPIFARIMEWIGFISAFLLLLGLALLIVSASNYPRTLHIPAGFFTYSALAILGCSFASSIAAFLYGIISGKEENSLIGSSVMSIFVIIFLILIGLVKFFPSLGG